MKKSLIYGLVFFIFYSCRKDLGQVNRGDYPDEIGKIIYSSCSVSGCHNSESYKAAGALNLENWSALFKGSNSGSSVIPYNSNFSSLCYYINTFAELGIQNKPSMPLNGTPLSELQVKKIKAWIDAGAKNRDGKERWAEDPLRKKLYAVNQGCDIVTVFDSETQLPIRYIEVGNKPGADTPHQIRVSPDGKYWYVIFINNNRMQKFRCSDDKEEGWIPLTPFAAGTSTNPLSDAINWNTFIITKDGKRAYCVSWSTNGKVAVVDLEKRTLLHYAPSFYEAHGIALNTPEDKIYVTAQYGNFITLADTSLQQTVQRSLQPDVPPSETSLLDAHDILLSPNGIDLLITCQKSNEVRVFNTQNETVTKIISTGIFPQEIVYSPSTKQYFVSCTSDTSSFIGYTGNVTRISAIDYSTVKIPCGFQAHGLACDERQGLLYVLSRNISATGPLPHHGSVCNGRNGYVNFIDLNSLTVVPKRYELSVDPYFIFAQP